MLFSIVECALCTQHQYKTLIFGFALCRGKAYTIKLGFVHCPIVAGAPSAAAAPRQGHRPLPRLPSLNTALQSDFAGRVLRVGLTICLQMILAVCSVQCAVCSVKRNNVSGYDQATHLATSGSDTAVRALALFANVHLFHNICPG